MNFEKLIESGYMEMYIVAILYAGLSVGDTAFLNRVYETGKIPKCWNGNRQDSKISSEAGNVEYEDIIDFIVEEICRKSNRDLYEDLMDFHLEKFPFVKEQFEDSANDVNKWIQLCFESHKHRYGGEYSNAEIYELLYNFMCVNFIKLYCMTYV